MPSGERDGARLRLFRLNEAEGEQGLLELVGGDRDHGTHPQWCLG